MSVVIADSFILVFLFFFLLGAVGYKFIWSYGLLRQNPSELWDFLHAGFSFFGGALLFTASLVWVLRRKHEDVYKWLDISIFPLLLLMIFMRVGDFMAGSFYGKLTQHPWGVVIQNIDFQLSGIKIHPLQLYAAAAALLIFIILMVMRFWPLVSGFYFFSGVILYSLASFVLEFYHHEQDIYYLLEHNFDKMICIVLAIVGLLFIWRRLRSSDRRKHVTFLHREQ